MPDGENIISMRALRFLCVSLSLSLSACGGGESSPPPPPPPPDSEPNAFAISSAADAARGTAIDSAGVTISGINTAAAVSIVGGEYSVDGGAFTSSAGSVDNAQSIVVRVTASSTPGGIAEATLTVGGVEATFAVTTSTDITPPTVTIVFPTEQSRTSANEVIVRGTASDDESIMRSVRVNGVEATSTDDFASWAATVSLEPGANTLVVDAQDGALNRSAATPQAAITRNAMIGFIEGLAFDAAGGRALAADAGGAVLLSIDLSTGLRSIVAKNASPSPDDRFWIPSALALEANGTHALMLDRGGPAAIMRVELATGTRTLVSGRDDPSTQGELDNALGMSVDTANDSAYVLSFEPPAIYRVDLTTGARSVLSDETTPDDTDTFPNPVSIALDPPHNRLLVGDQGPPGPGDSHSIYTVALDTGARAILSSNTVPNGDNPLTHVSALIVDEPRNRALVLQPQSSSIIAVDLATGMRTVFSSPTVPNTVNAPEQPRAIALDPAGNRALVVDAGTRALVSVDLDTGERTIISPNEPADIGAPQRYSTGIALDLAANLLYVTDPFSKSVNAVNLATGDRAPVSTGGTPWNFPNAVVIDEPRNQLLVADTVDAAVFAVDLVTGLRTVLSDNALPSGGVPLASPATLAIDAAKQRVLVTDNNLNAVVAVDLTTGTREVLSSSSVPPDGGTPLASPYGIAIDGAANRALVADPGTGDIVTVDLDTGVRTPFSSSPSEGSLAIAVDAATRKIVAGVSFGEVHVLDPVSGERTLVSNESRPRAEDRLKPRSLVVDGARDLAWATNDDYGVTQVIDLVTGERVFLTR